MVALNRLTLDGADCASLGHPVFIGNGKRADVAWSAESALAVFTRMLQGNPLDFFGKAYRAKDGSVRFVKSNKPDFVKHARWTWDSVCGRAKNKTSIFLFPRNARNESQWAAIDFDAHDADRMRARNLAFKAFSMLSRNEKLWLILSTSGDGGGWHLFIFTRDFYRVTEWTRFLREVAETIGQAVEKGVLEIFPDETYGRCGLGIRPPGVVNPKDNSCGRIFFDGASQQITDWESSSALRERDNLFLLGQSHSAHEGSRKQKRGILPTEDYEGSVSKFDLQQTKAIFRGENGEWQMQFAITSARLRHKKLIELVGGIFRQCSREVALENARLQYAEASPPPATSLAIHLSDFDKAWDGLERQWDDALTTGEREKLAALTTKTPNEREAFRIIRNWSCHDNTTSDFPIVAESLGRRLSVTMQTACNIRRRFCLLGILRLTAPYIPRRRAARFEWLPETLPRRAAHHRAIQPQRRKMKPLSLPQPCAATVGNEMQLQRTEALRRN